MAAPRTVVGLISLEPWDQVWRRNQHLATALLNEQLVSEIVFIEPATLNRTAAASSPLPGVTVIRPVLHVPRRAGGLRLLGLQLRRGALGSVTHLWINDPVLGVHCLRSGQSAVYDVTDDWRNASQAPRVLSRLIEAEDRLAQEVRTVVCSQVLRTRWRERYDIEATVVQNAISGEAWANVGTTVLPGLRPHVGYVGTLHEDRLDVTLVRDIAQSGSVGTVHLVGPSHLGGSALAMLSACNNIRLHGGIDSRLVPSMLRSLDVLVLPHVVTDFTLSLDAIKAYEYAASGRPVVATPTSGFQVGRTSGSDRICVTGDRTEFVKAVSNYAERRLPDEPGVAPTWGQRAHEFADVLLKRPQNRQG